MNCMMKWYLLKTKPKQEKIAIANLKNQNYHVYCPSAIIKKKNVVLFPGYLFIRLDKKESNHLLLLSTISFLIGSFNFVGLELLKAILPILLVSSVFSLMMIGHWFLVDPTISRVGMKNIAIFSTSLSLGLSVLVFFNFYESSSSLFNLLSNGVLNNVIVFLYISAAFLSFGSFKSLQEKSYTGVMASTGLSYLSLIVSMGSSGTLILSI